MDIRINRMESRIHTTDSDALLEPRIMHHIVRTCISAVKEELARDQRIEQESRLTAGVSSEE